MFIGLKGVKLGLSKRVDTVHLTDHPVKDQLWHDLFS